MTWTLPDLAPSETLAASLLVALLVVLGEADGTLGVLVIGLLHILDLPSLLKVVCSEARKESCSD
jgi:hypothetical protein